MFITLNNTLKHNGKIVVSNNKANINKAFIIINTKLQESSLEIKDNEIVFNGESEFIVDNNDPQLSVYVNCEHANEPRNKKVNDNEVKLFVNLSNELNYINKNGEKVFLIQGAVEK